MRRSTVLAGLAIAVLIIGPAMAHADLASDLRAQIAVVLAKLAAAQATQSSSATFNDSSTDTGGECPNLPDTLRRGSTGTEVAALQAYLARDASIYPEGTVSAYFGPATERALQRWQAAHGVVADGTPATTGYGVAGSQTRAAIQESCVAPQAPAPSSVVPPTVIACPQYQIPYCPAGVVTSLGTDAKGCLKGFSCVATTTPAVVGVNCPVYRDVVCSAGQKSAHGSLDIKGCMGPSACIPDNF